MKQLSDTTDRAKIVFGCVCFIVFYGSVIRGLRQPDPLEKSFYCTGCDGWGALHFMFFALLGFIDPNRHIFYCLLGVVWELIETTIGQNSLEMPFIGGRFVLIGDTDGKKTADGAVHYDEERWWYGRVTDLFFNCAGYAFGSHLNALIYGTCNVSPKQ